MTHRYHSVASPAHTAATGKKAAGVVVFGLMLLAFVAQSQLTQFVQTGLGYRHPYSLLYVGHSSFIFLFPFHWLYLSFTTSIAPQTYAARLARALRIRLSQQTSVNIGSTTPTGPFPLKKLVVLVSLITAGVTVPSLLWYVAITLASVSDVTAIWNSNAFWAYVIAVRIQKQSWELRKLFAVLIASVGVLIVVYGSQANGSLVSPDDSSHPIQRLTKKPVAPLIGNGLTLLASVGYGFYQVFYKIYVAYPDDVVEGSVDWESESLVSAPSDSSELLDYSNEELPFGFYSNFMASCIGAFTLLVLWIPIPILDYYGLEPFVIPRDSVTIFSIAGIAATGVVFNASLMILLGLWGPITASVGNLLTIVLVLISDVVITGTTDTLTPWSVLGSGMIIAAFAILASKSICP